MVGVVGIGGEGEGDVGISTVEVFGVGSCEEGKQCRYTTLSLPLPPHVVSCTPSLHQFFVNLDHGACFSRLSLALVIAGAVAKGASPPWDPQALRLRL